MINFEITKRSSKSRARLGKLKTSHGTVETPTLVPVATQATIKTLNSEEVLETGTQMVISNTFHLHLKPGEDVVEAAGGLHKFSNWTRPIMTDSAGYQVFSLGFGKDLQVGKIMDPSLDTSETQIVSDSQPREIKIRANGVEFSSPIDGQKLFIGPKESIAIQEKLGADIILAFDECTAPQSSYSYTRESLDRTNRWAETCLSKKDSDQAMYGIVQGGKYKDLRTSSASFVGGMPFEGFAIGGEFGNDKKIMTDMLQWVMPELPEEKPRHLLGIGHLEDIPMIIKEGVDTFDCIVPTHYARRAIAFTTEGKLNMVKRSFSRDLKGLDPYCSCKVCENYSRSYIHHLFKAKEISAMSLTTYHNLCFFNNYVAVVRDQVKKGLI